MATRVNTVASPVDNGTGATSLITVNVTPLGATAGDLIVAIVQFAYSNATGITQTGLGGQMWYEGTERVWSSTGRIYQMFVCVFNGTWAANPEWTGSGTTIMASQVSVHAYSPTSGFAWNLVPDVAEANNTTSTGTHTIPTVASGAARRIVLFVNCHGTDTATASTPTFIFSGSNQYRNTSNIGVNHSHQYLIQTSAAASGICSTAWSVAATGNAISVAFKEEAVVAPPSFSVDPAVLSKTENSYTVSFTASVLSTVYGVAVKKGESAPSAAQIKAGQNSAGAAAVASTTKSTSGSDTLVLGGSLIRPLHDLYFVLNNAGGDSAVKSRTNEFLLPPGGYQFIVADVPWGVGEDSFLENASPAAVDGDILVCSLATSPGVYNIVCDPDGVVTYNSGGDTSRQSYSARFYDLSLDAYSDSVPVTFWINNQAPVPTVQQAPIFLPRNAAVNYDLNPLWTDPEGDTLTIHEEATFSSVGLSGLSITGNHIVGTTPNMDSYDPDFPILATDVITSTAIGFDIFVGKFLLQNVVGQPVEEAIALLTQYYFNVVVIEAPGPGPLEVVLAQAPTASTLVDPGTTVVLTVCNQVVIPVEITTGPFKFDPIDKSTRISGAFGYASTHAQRPPGTTGTPVSTPKKTPPNIAPTYRSRNK